MFDILSTQILHTRMQWVQQLKLCQVYIALLTN